MIDNKMINRAIDYILTHIWEPFTLEDVAEHCSLSKFHFCRTFKNVTGESVYGFIKRVKMEQSALKLKVEKNRSITDIGLDYGYSASNYSSAFKKYHHTSPAVFRQQLITSQQEKAKLLQKDSDDIFNDIAKKITIQTLPDYPIIYERKISNYNDLKSDWPAFTEKHQKEITDSTIFFERTYDDPSITDKNHCLYDICMSVDPATGTIPNGIINGGKFAIYPFSGFITDFIGLHQLLTTVWFSRSGYELDERYSFDRYTCVDCDTGYMEFDICFPIR